MQLLKTSNTGALRTLTIGVVIATLGACSSGGTDLPPTEEPVAGLVLPESAIGSNFQEDPTAQEPVAEITAATGVQIEFASEQQQSSIGGGYIEEQWIAMQTCLQITATNPKVMVQSGRISTLSDDDDVLRFIDGSITATASVDSSSATIQITEADFDGSIGTKGSYLRSILGRYLWFSASLPERDYPFHCANQSG